MMFANNKLNTKIMADVHEEIFVATKAGHETSTVQQNNENSNFPFVLNGTTSDLKIPTDREGKLFQHFYTQSSGYSGSAMTGAYNNAISNNTDLYKSDDFIPYTIVTDLFIKTLNKVYAKLYDETITESSLDENNKPIFYTEDKYRFVMQLIFRYGNIDGDSTFKDFVDILITNGDLQESDRLTKFDQIHLNELNKSDCSVNTDTVEKTTTFRINKPTVLKEVIDNSITELTGKDRYLMINTLPETSNDITKNIMYVKSSSYGGHVRYLTDVDTGAFPHYTGLIRAPWVSLKAKTGNNHFGDSIVMGSHLFLKFGTQAEYDILPDADKPDIIVDHMDKMSALDELELKIDLVTHKINT